MVIECTHCGKEFERKPYEISETNYCSRNCYNAHIKGETVKCAVCGKSFYKKRSLIRKKNYCSRECFSNDKSLNSHLKTGKMVKCSFCGKLHYKKKKVIESSNEHLCCSRECYFNLLKSKSKAGMPINVKKKCLIEWCEICGKIFEVIKSRKNQKYCSVECQHKGLLRGDLCVCSNCGASFWRPPSQIKEIMFCSGICSSKYMVGENNPCYIKDRSKIKNVKHSVRFSMKMKSWRTDVYRRDNYTCQMCGSRSSKGNPVTLNAHHIKKFSTHKKLRSDVNNGITLCQSCHKKIYNNEEQYEEMFDALIKQKKYPGSARDRGTFVPGAVRG